MTDTPDTTTMTGAEFMRHVGTDARMWAEAFVAANYRWRWMPIRDPESARRTLRRGSAETVAFDG